MNTYYSEIEKLCFASVIYSWWKGENKTDLLQILRGARMIADEVSQELKDELNFLFEIAIIRNI